MTPTHTILDHQAPLGTAVADATVSRHASAAEALSAARFLAAAKAAAQGFSGVSEETCEDGTLLLGEVVDGPTGEIAHLEPLLWVGQKVRGL